VELEKSPDGIAGGWKLGGLEVFVNGREIYDNQHVDRWLEDNDLTWTAPDFVPSRPHSTAIPIWLNLREHDLVYGGDDEGDINPYDNRDIVSFGYTPGAPLQGTVTGGNKLGGRIGHGGDGASLSYRLETITPEPMQAASPASPAPPPPSSPPIEGMPDLAITAFTATGITVTNQGDGPAGAFRVKATSLIGQATGMLQGLAPGASETWQLPTASCYGSFYLATVDYLDQVEESDEGNNTDELPPVMC
jgi:CARDB